MPASDRIFRHRLGRRCVNDEPDDQVAQVELAVEPLGEGAEVGLGALAGASAPERQTTSGS